MRKEKVFIIKIIPFSVPLESGALTVYGKIYSVKKSIYWDTNYHYVEKSDIRLYLPPKECEDIDQAETELYKYIKNFNEDYMYNHKY
jgi:hypothetical protein